MNFTNTSSSSSNSTTTRPSLQNLVNAEEYNKPNEENDLNQADEPTDSKKRKREQKVANAKSDRWTDAEVEVLIPLYGEYYRKINDKARIRSPNRLQLNKKDMQSFHRAFIEQTGVQRTEKSLTDKWTYLKQQYKAKYGEKGKTGIGGGPLNHIDSLIREIVIDDPTMNPVATYDSLTRRLEVRKNASGSKPIVIDDEEETTNPEPEEKKPRRAPAPRKNKMEKRQETILDGIKKANEEALDKMKEIVKTPLVVEIKGNEERQRGFDRLNDILEKMYEKLE